MNSDFFSCKLLHYNTTGATTDYRAFRLGMLILMLLGALAGCGKSSEAELQQHAQRLTALKSSCQQTMLRNTCTAMTAERVKTAKPGEVVFVAGVGPVDAQLLESLQLAGEKMCDEVAASCDFKSWDGAACTALRAMYAPPS
jgi:hypothetical protein